MLLSFCSLYLCSSEFNPRQSGTSGVLPERLSIREASQEKKRCTGPETPPCAEPDSLAHQNPGQNPSEPLRTQVRTKVKIHQTPGKNLTKPSQNSSEPMS